MVRICNQLHYMVQHRPAWGKRWMQLHKRRKCILKLHMSNRESGDNSTKAEFNWTTGTRLICTKNLQQLWSRGTHTIDSLPVTFKLPLNLSDKVRVQNTGRENSICLVSNKQHNIKEAGVRYLQTGDTFDVNTLKLQSQFLRLSVEWLSGVSPF